MAHKHSVYDSDTHFEINPITKGVKNASSQKTTLMQYDHNSERFTFSLPRKIEEHDMSLCDKVRVHYINIDATNKYESIRGVYEVNDLQISPEDENVVICSWLISGNATQLAGQLNFRLQFLCYAEDGVTIDYAWHTAIHTGIFISDGINNSEMVIEQYSDVLAQWERDLFFAFSDVNEKIAENAAAIGNKQNTLVPGVNIKTINGESLLGSGNLEIAAAPSEVEVSYNTHDFIDMVGATVGAYVYKNGAVTLGTQAAYKHTVISLNQYKIKSITVITGMTANGVIPVLYLKGDTITDDNIIGVVFGEQSELLDGGSASSFALQSNFEPPVGTTHIAIGAYVNLTKLVSDTSRPAFDEIYKITVLENSSGGGSAENTGKTYVVRQTETASGEYATLGAALAVATGKDTIIMYPGVYEENHLNIPGGLTIKGIGDVVIKGYLAPDTAVATIENYSTFECSFGATFENITVTAQNMRYPIHADFSKGSAAKWVIKKCKFIHYGNEEAYTYQQSNGGDPSAIVSGCSAWGGGTYGGDTVYCEDCEFISNGRAFSTHNNEGATYTTLGPSNVKLVNCILTSHGIDRNGASTRFPAALFVQSLDCPVECEVILSNCKINGFVCYQNSGSCWSNKLKLFGCGDVKQVFDTYGSAKSSVADREQNQIAKFAADYTGFSITDSMTSFVNRGAAAIPAGYPVKKSSYGGVELCTNVADLYGIAMETIEPKKSGYIQTKGYISRIYLEGLRTTALTEGKYLTINSSGVFAVAGNGTTGLQVVDNQNVSIT